MTTKIVRVERSKMVGPTGLAVSEITNDACIIRTGDLRPGEAIELHRDGGNDEIVLCTAQPSCSITKKDTTQWLRFYRDQVADEFMFFVVETTPPV